MNMTKPIINQSVLAKIEKAKAIRKKADKEASQIESGALKDLKKEKKDLLEQVKQIDAEIERISGKPVANRQGGKRIDTEKTILEIVKELGKASCLAIETHPKMIARYKEFNREVAAQAVKLKTLVKEKKLVKTGERKKAVYSLV